MPRFLFSKTFYPNSFYFWNYLQNPITTQFRCKIVFLRFYKHFFFYVLILELLKNSIVGLTNCFYFPFQYNGKRWKINFSTILLFLFCLILGTEKLNSKDKLENHNQIRKCSDKLNSCLKKCNEEFPHFRSSRRGICKDACVQKSKEQEGCLIYYSSSWR